MRSPHFSHVQFVSGANWFIRKTFGQMKPFVEIEQDGDNFVIKIASVIMNREEKFTVGQEYEQAEMQGAVFKVCQLKKYNA